MSDKEQRIKREPPERDRPIRNMSGMFRQSSESGNGATPGTGRTARPGSPVERGVDMGYRVIDDQIRQGQRAAQQRHGGIPGAGFGAELGAGLASGLGRIAETMPDMATRMLRMWIQMMSMWMEMMDPRTLGPEAMGDMWSRWMQMMDPSQWPEQFSAQWPAPWLANWTPGQAPGGRFSGTGSQSGVAGGATRTEPSNLRVSVTTVSSRPVRVGFDLRPGCQGRTMGVQGLRPVDPDKPALDDVRFESDGELRIIVTVSDDHPEGLYTGWITDQQNGETLGMLSVHISI